MHTRKVVRIVVVIGALLLASGSLGPFPLSAAQRGKTPGSEQVVIQTGAFVGRWSLISALSTPDSHETNPSVAYNSQGKEYLVVWNRQYLSGDCSIFGSLVSSDGAPMYGSLLIAGVPGSVLGNPDVAYNAAQDQYLVVYSSWPSYGIYGQILTSVGNRVGGPITFASSATDQYERPAVAYAVHSDEYLVVWEHIQGASRGIEARSLSGDGASMSSILEVTGLQADVEPSFPDVAYTRASDEFLVVWQRWYDSTHTDHDVWGQRLSLAGGIHPVGSGIHIHFTSNDEGNPAVAAVPRFSGVGEYLIACEYLFMGQGYIAAQLMTDAGALHDFAFVSPSTGLLPAVASNENTREFLVAWKDGASIQARTVTTGGVLGPYAEAPGISPGAPAVAGGPLGDYLVTCHDTYPGYNSDVFGLLWGVRVFLPLVRRH